MGKAGQLSPDQETEVKVVLADTYFSKSESHDMPPVAESPCWYNKMASIK